MKKNCSAALVWLAVLALGLPPGAVQGVSPDPFINLAVTLDDSATDSLDGEPTEPAEKKDLSDEADETDEEEVDPLLLEVEEEGEVDELLETLEEEEFADGGKSILDPLKPWNLIWFHFNDKLYFWVMKPAAKGYGFVLPPFVRKGVRNFVDNLEFPIRFVSNTFQARPIRASKEFGRFLLNTTIGVAGLWDPATHWCHMKKYPEDFDQTLGVWRMGQCIYLVWPLVGPCSLRGTFGEAVDTALHPLTWAGGGFIDTINDISLDEHEYESLLQIAIDPYSSVRDAYVQNRKKVIAE